MEIEPTNVRNPITGLEHITIDGVVKLLSYGMTREQVCDYYNIDDIKYCEFILANFGIPAEQLEKQYKANMTYSIMQQLNHWASENPKILMYLADRVLPPVENKSTVTLVNDVTPVIEG